jgi:hypothetical protein
VNNQCTHKCEGRKAKLSCGEPGSTVRLSRGGGGQIWRIRFVLVDENRTMKPVEIVLRRGEREDEGEQWSE